MRALLMLALTLATVGAQWAVKLNTDKKAYAIGEPMTISVKSQFTGYLVLLWTDSSGVTRIAVPSELSRYDRVYAGQTLQVRDATGSRLEQTGPAGTETLQAFVTGSRIDLQGCDPMNVKDILEQSGPFGQATVTYTVR